MGDPETAGVAMSAANCPECDGFPEMTRLGAGGPDRFYLCLSCGLVRWDQYNDGGIVAQTWHGDIDDLDSAAAKTEARQLLALLRARQLELL